MRLIPFFGIFCAHSILTTDAQKVYCAEEDQFFPGYGTFRFPRTLATLDGTRARAPCPVGELNSGFQRLEFFEVSVISITKETTGLFKVCKLSSTGKSAKWEPDALNAFPIDCRTEGSEALISRVQRHIDNFEITPANFRSIQPILQLLTFLASCGDFEAATTLVNATSSFLNSYNNNPDFDASSTRILFEYLDEYSTYVPLIPGYGETVISPHLVVQNAQFPFNTTDSHISNYTIKLDSVTFRLPSEIIKKGIEQQGPYPKLRVVAYSGDIPEWALGYGSAPSTTTTTTTTTTTIRTCEPPTNAGQAKLMDYGLSTISRSRSRHSDAFCDSLAGITMSEGEIGTFMSDGEIVRTSVRESEPCPSTSSPVEKEDDHETKTQPNILGHWRIFSIDVPDADIVNLTAGFEYEIHIGEPKKVDLYNWTCVYWDELEKEWSTYGMHSSSSDEGIVSCAATHFTAFSVIFDPLPLPFRNSSYAPSENTVNAEILSITSSIGSAVSVVGLVGVIIVYGLFRSLRKERSNRILMSLSVSLCLMHLFSFSAHKDFWDSKCLVLAAAIHYFLHTSIFWMTTEALYMYQLLVSVFVTPETRFLLKRSLFAWGVPFIIVGTCVIIKPEVYHTGRGNLCVIDAHLSLALYYGAYMAPAVLALLTNFFIFVRIFKVLYNQTQKQLKRGYHAKDLKGREKGISDHADQFPPNPKRMKYGILSPTQIKGAFTLFVLVGVGWIVGLLAIGPFEVFFKYVFTFLNAGQGALIFLFRVVLHPQARKEIRKALLGFSLDSSEISVTSTTNVPTVANKNPLSRKSTYSGSSGGSISASNSVVNTLTPSSTDARALARMLAAMLRRSSKDKDQTSNDVNVRY